MHRVFLFLVGMAVCLLIVPAQVWSQSPLSSLLPDAEPKKLVKSPAQSPLQKLQARQKEVEKKVAEFAKHTYQKQDALDKSIQYYERLSNKYRKERSSDAAVGRLRSRILRLIQHMILQIEQLRTALSTYLQDLRVEASLLASVATLRATTEKEFAKKYKTDKELNKLRKDRRLLEKQLQQSLQRKKSLDRQLKKIERDRNNNQRRLVQAQRRLRQLSPVYREDVGSEKSDAQDKQDKLQKPQPEISPQQLLEITYARLQVEFYTYRAQLLHRRQEEIVLERRLNQQRLQVTRFLLNEMSAREKKLIAVTQGGLWYRNPLRLSIGLFGQVRDHTIALWRHGDLGAVWSKRWLSLSWWDRVLWLLLAVFLLPGSWWLRRRLRAWRERFQPAPATQTSFSPTDPKQPTDDALVQELLESEEIVLSRAQEEALKRPFHLYARLLLVLGGALLPWLIISLLLLLGGWLLKVDELTWRFLFTLMVTVLLAQFAWTALHQFFADSPHERVLQQAGHADARTFRRWLKALVLFAAVMLSLSEGLVLLRYPENFIQLLDAVFFGVLLCVACYLLMMKQVILSLIPTGTQQRRWRTILLGLFERLYPVILLVAVALYGVYLGGYVNFAGYLLTSLVLTVVVGFCFYALFRWITMGSLWLFGYHEERGNRLDLDPQWASYLLRLTRSLSGVLLLLLGLSILLQIWGVGYGMQTIPRLIAYPLVQVQNTQITAWSLFQFGLILYLTWKCSQLVLYQLDEKVYPALRTRVGNQQALNTTVHFAILLVGLLLALRWVGVGLGVLALFAGVVGIAVGFGTQNIASNFISGLIITYGKHIRVGDYVKVGDSKGYVREINTRSTTLENEEQHIFLLPNSELLTKVVTVLPPPDPEKAKQIEQEEAAPKSERGEDGRNG